MPNRNFWLALLVWASYWTFAPFMEQGDLFDLMNGLGVACAIGVIVAYMRGALDGVMLPIRDVLAGHYLVMGVVTVCTGFTAARLWSWTWRVSGKPEWMLNHIFLGWCFWVIASGYVLHLTSVGAVEGRIPRKNWIRLGICVAAAIAFCVIASLFD